MRLVVGAALTDRAICIPRADQALGTYAWCAFSAGCALLLVSGLWTPFAGVAVTLIEARNLLALSGDRWTALLLGTIGGALAMLGPGVWSIDARLFGWIRIKPSSNSAEKT